jgi:hypothetical protein
MVARVNLAQALGTPALWARLASHGGGHHDWPVKSVTPAYLPDQFGVCVVEQRF